MRRMVLFELGEVLGWPHSSGTAYFTSNPSMPRPRDALEGGEGTPFKGAQPMPSHYLPDGKCQPIFNGICNRQSPPPLATYSNRLSNRFWGRLWGPFPCNASLPRPFFLSSYQCTTA